MNTQIDTVDKYLATVPEQAKGYLLHMRKIIQTMMPEGEEVMSYGIPTYKLHKKNVVHIAGYKQHVGFYPGSGPIVTFAEQLKPYATSKGTVQFPLDKPLPIGLFKKMVAYCIVSADERANTKAKSGKPAGRDDFKETLSAPAQRALTRAGINTIKQLAAWTERDILALHGVGPSTIPKLQAALKKSGLRFKE